MREKITHPGAQTLLAIEEAHKMRIERHQKRQDRDRETQRACATAADAKIARQNAQRDARQYETARLAAIEAAKNAPSLSSAGSSATSFFVQKFRDAEIISLAPTVKR